jgi:hypothetical protein
LAWLDDSAFNILPFFVFDVSIVQQLADTRSLDRTEYFFFRVAGGDLFCTMFGMGDGHEMWAVGPAVA